jgi:hypothetical protein
MPALWDFFRTDGAAINRTLGREPPVTLPFGTHRGGNLPGATAMGYGVNVARSKI